MKKSGWNLKSQAEIITTILLILLVIGSIVVVWAIVNKTVRSSTSKSSSEILNIRLEISQVKYWQNGSIEVDLSRGADNGDMTELKFIFYNKNGNNKIISKSVNLSQKTSKQFFFTPVEIGFSSNEIEKVSVAPVFGENTGIEVFETKSNEDGMVNLYNDLVIPNGSLISWWKFDDNDARDYIDNNPGTLMGSANTNNNVLNLDGASGFVDITPFPSNLALGNKITISAWAKTTATNTAPIIKRGGYSAGDVWQDYALAMDSNGIYLVFGNSANYDKIYGGLINNNIWHHVIGILRSTNKFELYVDGIIKNDSQKTITTTSGGTLERIGLFKSTGTFFNGKIDDVMIFKTDLTASQIKTLYLNQNKTSRP